MALLSEEKGLVYVGVSAVGVIDILNVYTGDYSVAINNSLTNPPRNGSQVLDFWFFISLVLLICHRILLQFLAFTSSISMNPGTQRDLNRELTSTSPTMQVLEIIARVLINPETGLAAGEPEIVKSNLTGILNFVLDKDLNIFAASDETNQFVRIDGKTGEVSVLANSTQYAGPTLVAYGRSKADKADLYGTTKGEFCSLMLLLEGHC